MTIPETCVGCDHCDPTSGGWECSHEASLAAIERKYPGLNAGPHVPESGPPPKWCPLRRTRLIDVAQITRFIGESIHGSKPDWGCECCWAPPTEGELKASALPEDVAMRSWEGMHEAPPLPGVMARAHRHFTYWGIKRCNASLPCFMVPEHEAVECPCATRIRRVRILCQVIALDVKGAIPTPLPVAWGPYTVYHAPIFVFVCEGCGKHGDSYRADLLYSRPMAPEDWYLATREVPKELRELRGYAYEQFSVCSEACMERCR